VKNKLIVVFFATALFSSMAIFAADNGDVVVKKSASKKSVNTNLVVRTNALENQVRVLKSQIDQMQNKGMVSVPKDNNQLQFNSLLEMYAHGPAVVTSPVFGVRRPADGYSDLMVRLSSMNEDLVLLETRQKMDNYAKEKAIPIPTRPIIALSGGVEGTVNYLSNASYTTTAKSDINLSMAELDVIAEAGPWATAAMIINYEDRNDATSADSITRWSNSRIHLDRGWLTIGQLNRSPVYFSIGQVFASFGSYNSNMVTTSSTQILGRVKDRMVVLGYDQFGIYAQAYGYAGETKPTSSEIIKHGGFNLGYRYDCENFGMEIGAGVIGNLAESQGMQLNIFGRPASFTVNGVTVTSDERMTSRVYGLNGHAKATFYDMVTLLAEYVGASKSFDQTDLMFNNHGAKPMALNAEGSVNFDIFGRPSSVFAGYGWTNQALALLIPKQSFFAGYSISPIKYLLAAVEYRYDINYNNGDNSSSVNSNFNRSISVSASNASRHNNIVTAKLGVYF
jgi:hypothetical protein